MNKSMVQILQTAIKALAIVAVTGEWCNEASHVLFVAKHGDNGVWGKCLDAVSDDLVSFAWDGGTPTRVKCRKAASWAKAINERLHLA